MENKNGKKLEGMSTQNKVILGASLAALAAAAAGAVFFYGTEAGRKKRKEIKSWMLKMKADVLDQMETMKEWSEDSYNALVDSVAKRYEGVKNIDPVEIAALARDLKNHWKTIQRRIQGGSGRRKSARPGPARRRGRKPKKTEGQTETKTQAE